MKTKVQHLALELVHEPLGYVGILSITSPRPVREDNVHMQETNTYVRMAVWGYIMTLTHRLYDFPIVPDGTTQNHAEDHSYDLQ